MKSNAREYPITHKMLVGLSAGMLFLLLLCFGTANRMDHYASVRSDRGLAAPTKWTEVGVGKIVPSSINPTDNSDTKVVDIKLTTGTVIHRVVNADQADKSSSIRVWDCAASSDVAMDWMYCLGNTELIKANSSARPWDETLREAGHPETMNDFFKSFLGTLFTPAYLVIFTLIGLAAYHYDRQREAQQELWLKENTRSTAIERVAR